MTPNYSPFPGGSPVPRTPQPRSHISGKFISNSTISMSGAEAEASMNAYMIGVRNEYGAIFNNLSINFNYVMEGEIDKFYEYLKEALQDIIPVRSGKLLDFILNTLNVHIELILPTIPSSVNTPVALANAVFQKPYLLFGTEVAYPPDRPNPISNPAHLMEEGYGERYDPVNPIKNRQLIALTGLKTALYLLNDPAAQPDVVDSVEILVQRLIQDLINTLSTKWDELVQIGLRSSLSPHTYLLNKQGRNKPNPAFPLADPGRQY